MVASLAHRGPDGAGTWHDHTVALGHTRLAIIDLTTGRQPMTSEEGALAIVFNGEIYNYVELKQELEKLGCGFRTTSDTEVILHAYRTWGIDCQSRFNGMWAFAIWDAHHRQLFLSRDRVGEKPLHFTVYDDTFVFGSEIKALLAYGVPASSQDEMLEVYLTLGYVPAPYTFYKGIHKLRPGHCLIVRDGRYEEREYWHLPQRDEGDMLEGRDDVCAEFEHLLRDSVRLRMRSDVPFGAFLSGGLDSSSIVSLMAQHTGHPVKTFTIGFREKEFDERPLARQVAIACHTRHHEHVVEPGNFEESLQKVLYHYDEPFGDSSAIPTGYVSRCAREHVKMVLTGDGGDEVLSGYTSYQGEKFAANYQRLPHIVQRGIPVVAKLLGAPLRGSIRYRLNRAAKVCAASSASFAERLTAKLAYLPPARIGELLADAGPLLPFREFLDEVMRDCRYRDPFYRLMYFQFRVSLPDQMLTKVDRMSMAHSLEARVPFLDHRLVEFMVKVHKDVKMPGYKRKSVLRDTVGRSLPASLLSAPKRGFVVPLREWFKADEFRQHLRDLLDDKSGLQAGPLRRIVDANIEGREDNGNFIWMLFQLNRWRHQVH